MQVYNFLNYLQEITKPLVVDIEQTCKYANGSCKKIMVNETYTE